MPLPQGSFNRDWFAHESITIDSTVGGVSLTSATYKVADRAKAQSALLTVETAQIRYTVDGTAPTTTVGHLANVGDIINLTSSNEIVRFRAIRTGASSGTLKVSYAR